jgi:hypothetical protein
MSAPRVRSGRLAKVAIALMIALGVFSLLVDVTVAVIIIALGVAMYVFEWWLVRRVRRAAPTSD